MIIYITGKSGSGKSTFSKRLAKELNYKYIDVDEVGHKVYEFPAQILDIVKNKRCNLITGIFPY